MLSALGLGPSHLILAKSMGRLTFLTDTRSSFQPPTLIAFMLFQVSRFVFHFHLLPHKHVDIRHRQMTLTFSSKFL